MAGEVLLVDLGDSKVRENTKKRNSFYSLPKTLSEDDDPFGLFQSSKDVKNADQAEPTAVTTVDTKIGLLVQIDPDSPKVPVSESLYNRSSVSGSESQFLGLSGGSLRDGSSMFGNVSRISSTPYNISDDVFLQDSQSRPDTSEDEPNWDKLHNDAQFVAQKISEPAVAVKTPRGFSRFTSAVKFTSYSPCDPILDTSKEDELFLVQLTPEKLTVSPSLERKTSCVDSDGEKISVDHDVDGRIEEETVKTVEVYEQFANLRLENKTNITPKRKVAKENVKPRAMSQTEVKKNPNKQSTVPRTKLSLRQPSTEVKKPMSMMKSSSRLASTPSVTRTKVGSVTQTTTNPSGPVSAAKTLQFTPMGSGLKPAKREPIGQFKQPSNAVESKLKKLIPASRGGGGLTTNNLLKLPRPAGPLKPSTSAAPKNSCGVAKSGLARPSLYRSGSALTQSMLPTKNSTPARRPSDIGVRSGLPSPQIIKKNGSLVCSTPNVSGGRQSKGNILPSPISSVKRKV